MSNSKVEGSNLGAYKTALQKAWDLLKKVNSGCSQTCGHVFCGISDRRNPPPFSAVAIFNISPRQERQNDVSDESRWLEVYQL